MDEILLLSSRLDSDSSERAMSPMIPSPPADTQADTSGTMIRRFRLCKPSTRWVSAFAVHSSSNRREFPSAEIQTWRSEISSSSSCFESSDVSRASIPQSELALEVPSPR